MTDRQVIRVDAATRTAEVDPMTPLGTVLRDVFGLSSVRLPCGVGACGACTVLVDGRPVRSCLVPVGLVGDREVVTNDGIADDDPVRAAFVAEHAYQCGYCIPGFVLATRALLADDPSPGPDAIEAALVGNLCRCGSYNTIRRAIAAVVGVAGRSASALEPTGGDPTTKSLPDRPSEPGDPE